MRLPDLNAVECPTCGRMISTNSGKFRKHADDTILRECPMSGKSTPASERAAELVKSARVVLNLVEQVRDTDPSWIWRYLTSLDRRELQTLMVIALAAVPAGQDLETAFSWVTELADAQAVPA